MSRSCSRELDGRATTRDLKENIVLNEFNEYVTSLVLWFYQCVSLVITSTKFWYSKLLHYDGFVTGLDQILQGKQNSEALRRYPGLFAETLVALQKEHNLSNKRLADQSLVGEKTLQRLRNNEEYPTSVQTILGLCVGLKLPLPEAEMLLSKTDFKLNTIKMEGYVYQCVLSSCAENSIYEINEMLEANGIPPLGSNPELQWDNGREIEYAENW